MARKQNNFIEVTEMNVDRVREVKGKGKSKVIFFTLTLNGVSINNCKVVDGRNGEFVALPQYEGSDGNWYPIVWAKLSDEDQDKILEEVHAQL